MSRRQAAAALAGAHVALAVLRALLPAPARLVAFGAGEIELFLAWRARGLPVEPPLSAAERLLARRAQRGL